MSDKKYSTKLEETDKLIQFKVVINKDNIRDLIFSDGLISKDICNPDWVNTIKTTEIYKEHQESIDWVIKELKDNPNFPLPKEKIKKPFFYSNSVANAATKKDAFDTARLSVTLSFMLFLGATLLNAPSNNNGFLPCILGLIWSFWLAFKWTGAVTTYKNWEDLHELEKEEE